MAIGDSAELGYQSVVTISTETTFGTPITTTVGTQAFEFRSAGLTMKREELKAEGINATRSYNRRFQMNETVDGTIELDLHPVDGIPLLLHALGATVVTTANTAATAWTHSLTSSNNLNVGSGTSLTTDIRKGPTISRRYAGCRVNQMTIRGEIGSPIQASYELVGKKGTTTVAIADSAVGFSAARPFLFLDGAFEYASTEASLTSTSIEHIQSFQLTVNNNITSDNNARSIGTSTVQVLPPGMRDVSLTIDLRADTTAVYDRFISNSQGSVRLELISDSITSAENYTLQFVLPKVFYNAGDHEVSGPDVLTISPEITAIRSGEDPTTTNSDIKATLINDVSAY